VGGILRCSLFNEQRCVGALAEKIALTDILLLQMGNELHTGLLWNSVQLPEVLCVGDADIF
jgi:hypothetical protein